MSPVSGREKLPRSCTSWSNATQQPLKDAEMNPAKDAEHAGLFHWADGPLVASIIIVRDQHG